MSDQVDWFSEHVPAWQRVLVTPKARALLIGTYDGRCVRWLFDNVLTSPRSTAVVVDRFDYPDVVSMEGRNVRYPATEVEATFKRRLADVLRARRLRVVRKEPYDALVQERRGTFDLVYIDARGSSHAMETAVMAFRLMAPGAMLVITNNTHGVRHDATCPRRGIDGFLDAYAAQLHVLRQGFHVFAQKRELHLRMGPCEAEYFVPDRRPNPATTTTPTHKNRKQLKPRQR